MATKQKFGNIAPQKPRWVDVDQNQYEWVDLVDTETPLVASEQAPAPKRTAIRAAADTGLEVASGAVKGIKFMSDVFGADNAVSTALDDVSKFAKSLQSAQAQGEDARMAQIMKEAEDKGIWEQVKAAASAASEAPIRQSIGAVATGLPMIAASMVPGMREAAWGTRLATMGGLGAAQGVGMVKSSMRDAVYQRAIEEGRSQQEAAELADQAQSYQENPGQIALGGLMGGAATATGFAPAMVRALSPVGANATKTMSMPTIGKALGMGVLKEVPMEAAQGGHEQLAGNVAQNSAGFATPLGRGVAGSAAMEGMLAAPGGAVGGAFDYRSDRADFKAQQSEKSAAAQAEADAAAAAIRANKQPGSGPLSNAVNAGTEADAQKVEVAGASAAAAIASTPDLADTAPSTPSPEGSAEFINPDFQARQQTLAEQMASPENREKVRARFGDDGLNQVLLQPLGGDAQLGGMVRDPLTLDAPEQTGAQPLGLGLDQTPSGRFTVDARGNAVPETAVQRGDAQRRADEMAGLGGQKADILNPSGQPFKTKLAADLAAKKTPGEVAEVPGGYVIRAEQTTPATKEQQAQPPAQQPILNNGKPFTLAEVGKANQAIGGTAVSVPGGWAIQPPATAQLPAEAPATAIQPAATPAASTQSAILGRNSQPIAEGGQPFATREEAKAEKRLHPLLRVAPAEGGGFILKPASERQLSAVEKAAKRLKYPSTGETGPRSLHGFILQIGGLASGAMPDVGFDLNPRVGNRRLFSPRGKTIEQAAMAAKQEGYIQDEDENTLIEALKRSLNVSPVYTPDGYEAMAEAQMQARYEDFLAAEQDGVENDWSRLTPEELADTGYNDYDEATQAEVRALVAQAEALGVDAESILEDVAQRTENATQKDYENAAKSAIEAAIRSSEESRSRDLGQAGAEAGPATADTQAAPAAVTGPAPDVRARNLAALKARMMAGQTKPSPTTPPAQTKATPAPEAGPTNQGATNGQGQETLLKAEQPTGAAAMVSGAPVAEQPSDTTKPAGGSIEKANKAAAGKVDSAPAQQPAGSIDGIVIKPGKGLIKGKFKAEVDGVGLPGDAFNTEQEAYEAALKYREVLAKRANEGAEAQRRKDAIAESFRNGDQVTNAQIESLGLKSDFSDMRWFMSTAADLFGLNSRQIRPIVKDLIKVRRSDMGTEYEYVPTRKALEAIASSQSLTSPTKADIEAQQARAEQASKAKAAQDKADTARAAKERERKDVAAASVAAADTFELGQDAMENLTGQQDVFGAMEQEAKLTPPKATGLTPKQYHEAKLAFIAADTGASMADVRENYDTEAGRAENNREWAGQVERAANAGDVLTRQTLDKLYEMAPNVLLPETAIPQGYQRPEARRAEADDKQALVDGRKAAKAGVKDAAPSFTDLEKELQAQSHATELDGDIGIVAGGGVVRYVSLEDAAAAAKKAIESGVRPVAFQILDATGIRIGDVDRVLEQVKGENEQGDDSLMFSRAAAKEVRDLVTLHNLSEDNLMYAGKMGGIPVPSIGITKVETPFGGFGGITLIAPKDLIDPEAGVPVYDRDAWTARFPELNFKKIKVKVADAFYERMSAARDLGGDGGQFMSSLFDELRNARVQSPDKITSLFTRYSAPKMLYAQEVLGKAIKPQMRGIKPETPFGHTKAWRDFVAKSDTRNMTEQREREFNREAAVAARAAMTELGETRKEGADERTARMLDSSLKSYLDRYITEDGMNAGILDRALRDVKSFGKKEIDPMKMDEAVRKVVPLDDAGYKKWVASLVEPPFEAPTITVRGSEVPVTLENVVEAMTIGKTAGAEKSMTFGVGKAASMLGKQFKSIEEIKAARDQVVSAASEKEGKKSTEALISEYQNHVSAFYTGKDWKGNIDTWAALDSSLEALTKAGRNPTDGAMNIALQRSGFKRVDAKGISLAKQALEALRDATTDYFEAKPQRAVRLNEFNGAVVPKGTSAEAIALLEENGITVEIHGNAEGAREKAIQKLAKKLDGKTGSVIFSRAKEQPRTPAATIRAAITKAYGNLLDKLEAKGLVTIAQTEREAIEAAAQARADKTGGDAEAIAGRMMSMAGLDVKYSANGNIEGFFDKQTGKSFLVADNLTAASAPGTLMHEVGIHMAAGGNLDRLFKRAAFLIKNNRGQPFFDRVRSRMEKAGETSAEEAAAYLVTEYETDRVAAPKSVVQWVREFMSDVRAWLFGKGVALKPEQLTVADIAAVARANARSLAKGGPGGGQAFSHTEPQTDQDIRFSRAADMAGNAIDKAKQTADKAMGKDFPRAASMPDLNDDQRSLLGKVGASQSPASDAIKAATDRAGLKIRQGMVDRFAALKELDEKALGQNFIADSITNSAWVLAKMSSAGSGALNAMMKAGRIEMDANQKVIGLKGAPNGGLTASLQKLGGPAEVERFFAWVAANRAEKLMVEGRENLFTPAEIAAGKTLNTGTTEGGKVRPALYSQVHAEFQQYRDDVLAIAEQAGIINSENRAMWRDEFYVPFYRVMEDDADRGRSGGNGLSRQEAYKKLKGGKQNLNDLMENTLMNFHHLLSASLKNQAAVQAIKNAEAVGIARKVPEARRDTKTSTFVLVDGKKVFYEVDDPLVFESITTLADPGLNNTAVRVMGAFKRLFTNMTTTTPQFIIANTFRDLLQASATSPTSKNIAKNLKEGIQSYRDEKTRAEMLASGGAFSFGHIYGMSADEVKESLQKTVAGAGLISSQSMIPSILRKGWDAWGDITDLSENASRAATYTQNVDELGKLRAAFEARDVMDFSQHGAWPAVRLLVRIVPFLNARLQGLDKLYRSGLKPSILTAMGKGTDTDKQAAARFAMVTGALTLATMALYLVNADDDEYKKLEEWQKDTYWFIRIGENAFFLPKPFEVGAIATMAERTLQQAMDDKATGKLFRERMWEMLMQTFAFNPTPQMFQPLIDVYSNKDAFTGRDIESAGMERMSAGLRSRDTTTAPATALSAVSRVFGDESAIAVSPVQADHLIKGYLGGVGAMAAGSIDTMYRAATGQSSPDKAWSEYQPIRRFYRDLDVPVANTRYTTLFYDGLKEANRVYADVMELQKLGRPEDAATLAAEKRNVLQMRIALNAQQRRLTEINNRMKEVRRSDKDGEWKRREIDMLNTQKAMITERLGKRIEDARAQ